MQRTGGTNATLEDIFENLAHRDYADTTRKESPLTRAEDAVILDNTVMTEAEQLDFALERVHDHLSFKKL
jgi:cytidylate kinase